MRAEELLQLLRERPFQPFRVHVADGRVYDVRFPDINLVGDTFVGIGIPQPNVPDPIAERLEIVMLDDIRRVELDNAEAPTAPPHEQLPCAMKTYALFCVNSCSGRSDL